MSRLIDFVAEVKRGGYVILNLDCGNGYTFSLADYDDIIRWMGDSNVRVITLATIFGNEVWIRKELVSDIMRVSAEYAELEYEDWNESRIRGDA